MDNKSTNDWLFLGIFLLVVGLILAVYSLSSYVEVKTLSEKIDFEQIDNNNSLSSSEKYYKYISIGDYLVQMLNRNKNLPVKNTSCIYLDYAQHNAIELQTLSDTRLEVDDYKRDTVREHLKTLRSLLDNYNTCPKTKLYKDELDKLLNGSRQKSQPQDVMQYQSNEEYNY